MLLTRFAPCYWMAMTWNGLCPPVSKICVTSAPCYWMARTWNGLCPPVSKICVTSIYNVVTHWSEPWNSGHYTYSLDELVVVVSNTIVDIFMKFN
jgi:hypothetical protein